MSQANHLQPHRGLLALKFTREEQRHPLFKKIVQAFAEERETLRTQLEHPSDIAATTLLRGELRMLTRISARTLEVGPESRQSEPEGSESASPALAAERFPVSFEQ